MNFDWQTGASTIIVISLIFSGIAYGIGSAFNNRRVKNFGKNEFFQAIINSAILGGVLVISSTITTIGTDFSTSFSYFNCTQNITPPIYEECVLNNTLPKIQEANYKTQIFQNHLAYYETLKLNFGNFSIQPLKNLYQSSNTISYQSNLLSFSLIAGYINQNILSFISSNWFGLIFASGLLLRSFFLTRKFGSFLIVFAIGFILLYPSILLLFSPPYEDAINYIDSIDSFTNSSFYPTPILDLNDNNVMGDKIYNMSIRNESYVLFVNDNIFLLTKLTSKALFYFIVLPIISLFLTFILIRDMSYSFADMFSMEVEKI